jgi:hypothetical protein
LISEIFPGLLIKVTNHCALRWCIAPRLIITRENTEMAPANELFVVKAEDRVVAIQEVWVEYNFDAVVGVVK